MRKLLDHDDPWNWEWCYNSVQGTFQCEHGCCGSYPDENCCVALDEETGAILALFFGIMFLLFLIAACALIVCCVCACKKQQGRRGRIVDEGTPAATTIFGAQPYPAQPPVPAPQPYPEQQFPIATHPVPQAHQMSPTYPSVPPPAYSSLQQPYPIGS